MDTYKNALTIISILTFLTFIPLALINEMPGWLPELFIFIGLTLFYAWTYDSWRMTLPIFTMLIIGHILHACGIFGWYHISPLPIQWDHITHFFGAFPFALLFYRFFEQWMDAKVFTRKNLLLLLAVFVAATGVGAVVELSEFVGYLKLGFGEGAFQFGPGDGIAGLDGTDLIDALGGGWINEGWDFIFNTLGIIAGMALMLLTRLIIKKPKPAYYYHQIGDHSEKF